MGLHMGNGMACIRIEGSLHRRCIAFMGAGLRRVRVLERPVMAL